MPDGSHVTFRYDPLGNRIEIAHGTDIVRYAYDGSVISAEYDGDNNLVATYVHTPPRSSFAFASAKAVANIPGTMAAIQPNTILEMKRGAERYFHVVDGLGSVIALIDISATIRESDRYDAYGRLFQTSYDAEGNPSTGDAGNRFAYTGVVRDHATNLYLMPLRAYDPSMGRFLTEDPLPDGNQYAYALNNPTQLTDPSGAATIAEFGWIVRKELELAEKVFLTGDCNSLKYYAYKAVVEYATGLGGLKAVVKATVKAVNGC